MKPDDTLDEIDVPGGTRRPMQPLQQTSYTTLRTLLAGQPTSAAKMTFAWQIVAGVSLARHAQPQWIGDGVLRLRAESAAWARELRLSRDVLIERLNELLGRDVITRLEIESRE
jgi:predicted nucleic acid-binding Zn ribbon protein